MRFDTTWLLVFLACSLQVGLITLQSINANQKRYTMAVFTSIGISLVAVYASVHVIKEPLRYFLPYMLGNAIGVLVAMKLDTVFARKRG